MRPPTSQVMLREMQVASGLLPFLLHLTRPSSSKKISLIGPGMRNIPKGSFVVRSLARSANEARSITLDRERQQRMSGVCHLAPF